MSARAIRAVAWLGFFGFLLLAWAALFWMQQSSGLQAAAAMPVDIWAALCQGAERAALGPLVAMWAIMSAAMMMPGFIPAFRDFLRLPGPAAPGLGAAVALVLGYLAVWLAASLGGALAQQQLAGLALLAPTGQSLSPLLTVALLLAAGAYQFSSLKEACLSKCRMPLTFFLERWAPGASAAFGMGLDLGALCLGCCWALMLLAFVGGMTNLMWMGAATLFMAFEKLPLTGRYLARPAGFLLLLAGLAQLCLALL